MNRSSTATWFLSLAVGSAIGFQGGTSQGHTSVKPDALVWKSTDIFPSVAENATLVGDPHQPGDFTIRVRTSGQYKVPPYSQAEVENVTVLSGTLYVGFGPTVTTSSAEVLKAGGFISINPGTVHYWWTEEASVVQFHGNGCLQPIYVGQTAPPIPCRASAH